MRTAALRPLTAGLIALLLAGCGDDGASPLTTDPTATSTATASATASPSATATATASSSPTVKPTTASPSPVGTMQTTVYYLHDASFGPRLQKEVRTVPRTTATLRAAVDAMLHLAPLDPDYRSLWPRSTTIRGVSVAGDTATVDLSREATTANAGSAYEEMSLQQLVWTVTAVSPSIKKVRLLINGTQGESLWGHSSYAGTMRRKSHNDVLPPISVESPQQGATVPRKLTFRGSSNTYEANVEYRITRTCAPGTKTCTLPRTVYADSNTTATAGTGTRGTWSVTRTLPSAAGQWIEIRVFESSAMDGSERFADTKVVRVS